MGKRSARAGAGYAEPPRSPHGYPLGGACFPPPTSPAKLAARLMIWPSNMFILIDNYDSFTYNLFHYLGELGARIDVHRNDKIAVAEVMAKHPQGIILSPGPC